MKKAHANGEISETNQTLEMMANVLVYDSRIPFCTFLTIYLVPI